MSESRRSEDPMYVPPRVTDPREMWSSLRIRGNFCKWTLVRQNAPLGIKARGGVVSFSASSRFRMLCRVAQVDWSKPLGARFLTCTFPDQLGLPTRDKLNLYRQHFWRNAERMIGKPTPALWRVEWKNRLTGIYVGKPMPHFHFLAFNCPRFTKAKVRLCWKRALKWTSYVDVSSEFMDNTEKVGIYVSKYAAKVDAVPLGYDAKHTIPPGRQWGTLRLPLLPLCQVINLLIPPSEAVDRVYAHLEKYRRDPFAEHCDSFTLIGPAIKELFMTLLIEELDKHIRTPDNTTVG